MKAPQPLPPLFRLALSIIRATPLNRGKSRRIITKWLKVRINYPIVTRFRGVPFILHLDNTTESKALFGRYNLEELAFLNEKSSRCDAPVFVDLGANSGFYTQNFLACNPHGTALAIEPNPAMCARIKANYGLLEKGNLLVECCAAGMVQGEMELDLSSGFGGAHITSQKSERSITVRVDSLSDILARNHIEKMDVMKVDIEGYEDKALIPFFSQAEPHLFPLHIIIEHTSSDMWSGDLFAVLKESGYVTAGKTRGNLLLTKG